MSIESVCPGCSSTLRVADEYAGLEAQCPICSAVYKVPKLDPPPSAVAPSPLAAQADLYYAKVPAGSQYGPVSAAVIEQWKTQGRLNADCHVRSVQATEWTPLPIWLEAWAGRASGREAAAATDTPNAFGTSSTFGRVPSVEASMTSSPRAGRGVLILILGMLSWFFCITGLGSIPFAIAALLMGRSDLQGITRGDISSDQRASTLIGVWLAGIALLLNLLVIVVLIATLVIRA